MQITNKGLPHPFALTLFEDAIYWTDWHTKSISTVNKKTGMGIQTVHASLHVPMDIRRYILKKKAKKKMFLACLKFYVYSCVLLDTVSTHCANSEHIRIDVAVIMVDAHTCACPTPVDTHAAVPLDSTSTTTGK